MQESPHNESDLEDSAFFMYILPLKNSNIFIYDDLKVKTFSNKADVTREQGFRLLDYCLTGAMAGQATPSIISAPTEFTEFGNQS